MAKKLILIRLSKFAIFARVFKAYIKEEELKTKQTRLVKNS